MQKLAQAGGRPSLLAWIIAFKAFKTITLTALGTVLLSTRRADPIDVLMQLALAIHLSVTSRLFERLLTWVSSLTVTRETALGITAFAYAALMGTEGVSLYFRKRWARWFTIIATSSLIPLELYEILRQLRPIRVLVLLANVAIVVYLFKRKEIFD